MGRYRVPPNLEFNTADRLIYDILFSLSSAADTPENL